MRNLYADIGTIIKVALGAFIAVGAIWAVTGRQIPQPVDLTVAPDLVSVGSFRAGPSTDDGEPQTLVDFVFDEPVAVSGGDRSNFHLVNIESAKILDGRGVQPVAGSSQDDVVTVLFPGQLRRPDFARGYVDRGTVKSQSGSLNVTQAAATDSDGTTAAPDLVSVVLDEDRLVYRFDQALALGGGNDVQDTQGFTAYDQQAVSVQANTAKPTDDDCLCEIAVTFDDFDAATAVGASVSNGAVADRNTDDLINQPDETQVTKP